jgi:hypothetical protein
MMAGWIYHGSSATTGYCPAAGFKGRYGVNINRADSSLRRAGEEYGSVDSCFLLDSGVYIAVADVN